MQKTLLSMAEWHKLALDMPFSIPREAAKRAATALVEPGCALKTKKRDPAMGGFPEDYGRLLVYGPQVVVLSWPDREILHPDKSVCKWTGTIAEYEAMWNCD